MSTASDDRKLGAQVKASLRRAGATRQAEIDQVVLESLTRLRSIASLGATISKLPAVPPGLARTAQASENAWRRIEQEFGMLTSIEVSQRIGSRTPHRNLASEMRQKRLLLGVARLNSYRYPGFQFADDGSVRGSIPALLSAAEDAGWSASSLALWLCNPSGSFAGDRPVDHLDDDRVVDIASDMMATDW